MITPKSLLLANLPTPIQKIYFNDSQFFIKRDDYTGMELSGNKIRKLEFILYEALKNKSDYVFTRGGEQSNHARATAIAAASLGIKSKLFLWGPERKNYDGNMFLDKMVNAEIVFMNWKEYQSVKERMEIEKEKMEKKGHRVTVITEGGSSPLGIWGYINFVTELTEQVDPRMFKGILSSCGSGGTSAGLLVGCALFGLKYKIFAVNVFCNEKHFREKILNLADECIKKYKLNCKIEPKNLEVIEGYSLEGYKKIQPEKLKVIKDFAAQTGIIFDPVYTGKSFYAYNELFLKGKKKSDILFIHTGGLFGMFPKRNEYMKA
ncbi:MAG: pyridoxal-phosphate dependent enzyme [Ignavibacteriales bacterium]|nr:pyridoxal-phosphate dependent enzyme [Ignavibacteriales bacterium]